MFSDKIDTELSELVWAVVWMLVWVLVLGGIYIVITYKLIAVLQLMMFTHQQITEKLNKERLIGFYTL